MECLVILPQWLQNGFLSLWVCSFILAYFSSVQSLSCVRLFVTPWTAARQASLSINNSQTLLKFMSIELVMPSNHLILCHPLLFLQQHRSKASILWHSAFIIPTLTSIHDYWKNHSLDWMDLCWQSNGSAF